MIHLIYISSATRWPSEDDLKELLEQSRSRNLRQDITGLLLYDNATYMQVLEGSEKDVHEVYDAILNDPRNNGNVTLVEEELPGFQDVFNGKLYKELAVKHTSEAFGLLM